MKVCMWFNVNDRPLSFSSNLMVSIFILIMIIILIVLQYCYFFNFDFLPLQEIWKLNMYCKLELHLLIENYMHISVQNLKKLTK